MQLSVLASGSKGNCIYVASERVRLLVDAGLSAREIERRLGLIGGCAAELDAVIITHEHTDHVRGLGPLARRYRLPVYLNRCTCQRLPEQVGRLGERVELRTGRTFTVEDLVFHPFSISHDAGDPVGLTIRSGEGKVGICTDLGRPTRLVLHHLQDCTLLVLEANHDLEMLGRGPYPWALKQRIRGTFGHLSNQESVEILTRVFNDKLDHLVLAHVSEINNCPELLLNTFGDLLQREEWHHLQLSIATPYHPGELILL